MKAFALSHYQAAVAVPANVTTSPCVQVLSGGGAVPISGRDALVALREAIDYAIGEQPDAGPPPQETAREAATP